MKQVIEHLKKERAMNDRFNDHDEWYIGLLKERGEPSRAAEVQDRLTARKEYNDELDDAVEFLEEKINA